MSAHSSPWIEDVLAGVFVLRNVDGERAVRIIQAVGASYVGPDFGGFDYMPPNAAAEAWLLLGRWADCFEPAVRQAARLVDAALTRAALLDDAGIRAGENRGEVILAAADAIVGDSRRRVEIAALHAYAGRLAIRWWEGDERARLEALFPSLPGYVGLHMGVPHWLGTGMAREGARITRMTPYVRMDFVAERGLSIAALAEPAAMESWLTALRSVTGWP